MSNSNSTSSFSLATVLFLIFLTLKLTNFITWSWWWVTAPLWIPVIIIIAFFTLYGFCALLINAMK